MGQQPAGPLRRGANAGCACCACCACHAHAAVCSCPPFYPALPRLPFDPPSFLISPFPPMHRRVFGGFATESELWRLVGLPSLPDLMHICAHAPPTTRTIRLAQMCSLH